MIYPLANIGVSGKLHDVCNRLSSSGLCIVRFGNAPDIIRRRVFDTGKSCSRVLWRPCGDVVEYEFGFLYDLL